MNTIQPMLAKIEDKPFNSKEFIFEVKWDGERIIAVYEKNRISFFTRNKKEIAFRYPEIANELPHALKNQSVVLDGEIVVLDKKGVSSFPALQNRIGLNDKDEIESWSKKLPVYFMVFDLLKVGNQSLFEMPLIERKEKLKSVLAETKHIKLPDYIFEKGVNFYKAAEKKGLEGIIAKKKTSQYFPGKRSADWLKIKIANEQEFVIGGFTFGAGSREKYFGALLVGYYQNGKLVYAGNVGTGFDEKILMDLTNKMSKIKTDKSPFENLPIAKNTTFVKPQLVGQFKFREWTPDAKLRQPVYLGLRFDKKPKEVIKE